MSSKVHESQVLKKHDDRKEKGRNSLINYRDQLEIDHARLLLFSFFFFFLIR